MKKGFTLIELLAVIVVLALIALIVTPIISRITKNSKEKAAVLSIYGYIESVNGILTTSIVEDNESGIYVSNDKYVFESGFDEDELEKVKVNGDVPTFIHMEYDGTSNSIRYGQFCIKDVSVEYIEGVASVTNAKYCDKAEPAPGLYNHNNSLVYTWEELEDVYGLDLEYMDHESTLYRYDEDEKKFYYYNSSYNKVYVNVENINSGNPSVVFAKNSLVSGAFANRKLVLDGSKGYVPSNAFADFIYDIDIVIPSGITEIRDGAFYGSKIRSVLIGPDVTVVGGDAFDHTPNLRTLTIPDNVLNFGYTDGYYQGGLDGSGVEIIKIGKGIKKLPDSFCRGCENLTSIVIPSNIEEIGNYAFYGTGLQNITIKEGVKTIGDYAFQDTRYLEGVKLPNSLTSLGIYAFSHSGITDLEIGSGLSVIKSYAFANTKINSISIPDNIKKVESQAFAYTPAYSIDFGNGIEEFEEYSFDTMNIEVVHIPASTKKIGAGVIAVSTKLKQVIFDNPYYWTIDGNCNLLDFTDSYAIANVIKNATLQPAIIRYDDISECPY